MFKNIIVIGSTVMLLIAHIINMFLTQCPAGEVCFIEIGPLVIIGLGYSLYAAALCGFIPYVVESKTVGTAFGFVTAI